MTRWRWALVAAVVAANILAFLPLLRREVVVECRPQMELPEDLLAGVATDGSAQELAGARATWQLSGPMIPPKADFEGKAGGLPLRAQTARRLCTKGLPCALKAEADGRFALLWVEASAGKYAGSMVVQDQPGRRLTLKGPSENTPENAACGVLAAWFAFARIELDTRS